jgi:hypothetical protein
VLIEGHTDGVGSHAHNMKLSDDRAVSVKNWLVLNAGVSASRITTRGFGETKPVAPNTNPNGSDNPAGSPEKPRGRDHHSCQLDMGAHVAVAIQYQFGMGGLESITPGL